jgi:DNA-binding protein HU-beta
LKTPTSKRFTDATKQLFVKVKFANLLKSLLHADFQRCGQVKIHRKKFCQYLKRSKFVVLTKTLKNFTIMNKADLINKVAEDAGVTKTQANAALDSFVEAVTKALKGGGKVTLVGFGTFSVSKRQARNGRNPQTGEVIKIKARKVARFKAGKELSGKL